MLKRYYAEKDSTITNARNGALTSREKEANMGASDILEAFSLYGRYDYDVSENELSRILVKFDISDIASDISAGLFSLASAKCYLKLYNAAHGETLPRDFSLYAYPLTHTWVEGEGLDMEDYKDTGGVCWYAYDSIPRVTYGSPRDVTKDWVAEGGDYDATREYTSSFSDGDENLLVDVTTLVGEWVAGTIDDYGLIIKFSSAVETGEQSLYSKRFFGRFSEYFFKRPVIEVQWDDSEGVVENYDRENFYAHSALKADNTNTLFLYNKFNGVLEDIPGYGSGGNSLTVRLYNTAGTEDLLGALTASWERTGVYSVDVDLTTELAADTILHDRWYLTDSTGDYFYEGDVTLKVHAPSSDYDFENKRYVTSLRSLKPVYYTYENARIRIYTRDTNWRPNTFVVYQPEPESSEVIQTGYYKVVRTIDKLEVVPFSHEEVVDFSKLSYDEEGNYFDFNFDLLEPGYMYAFKLLYKIGSEYVEQPEEFKFRVEEANDSLS